VNHAFDEVEVLALRELLKPVQELDNGFGG
jgi:hypothetical protein